MTTEPDPMQGTTISGIGQHLSGLEGQIRSGARHSRNFSWFSWTFLFAVYLGIFVFGVVGILLPVVTTTTSATGTATTTEPPWWILPVCYAPAVVLLALGVREIVLGRHEVETGVLSRLRPAPESLDTNPPTWTETVQRCQKMVTHAKNETEWSFVPLVLGLLGFGEFLFYGVVAVLLINLGSYFVFGPILLLPALALLWPIYRAARGWIASYQGLLDRQVGEISRLEAEFLTRFAGAILLG